MDTTLLDDVNLRKKWYNMRIEDQISNIGSEVHRAIKWDNQGNHERACNFCNKAKELLQLSMEDPKNRHRRGELFNAICELDDRFLGDNSFHTSDEVLIRYYDAFI